MASFAPDPHRVWNASPASKSAAERLPEELVAPVVAGAHARGMADTLDALGLAGVFLDHGGRVLFANDAAKLALRDSLRVRTGHLVADSRGDNRLLSELIAGAVSGSIRGLRSCVLPRAGVTLHAIAMEDHLSSAAQLLRAIILLDDGSDACMATLAKRMAAMSPASQAGTAKL